MNKKYICAVAGKSGGHILPALTYCAQYSEHNVLFFSTDTELDKNIIKQQAQKLTYITCSLADFPGKKILRYPRFIAQFILTLLKAMRFLVRHKPEKVISMGGYISIPICLAAYILQIPVELFELNAVPGKAISFLSKFATKIHVCFDEAKKYLPQNKTVFTKYPLRFVVQDKTDKNSALAELDLDKEKTTLLVLGGSQGSEFINNLVVKIVSLLSFDARRQVQVIHQTGSKDLKKVKNCYEQLNVQACVFDYSQNLATCYNAADLVFARAGAGTLFELDFFNKRSIIIPLEVASTVHQLDNAKAFAQQKPEQFRIVRQHDIDNSYDNLLALFTNLNQ